MDSETKIIDGPGIVLRLEIENVNGAISKVVESGATQDSEIYKEEDGGIFAKLKDPCGTTWIIDSRATKNNCTIAESKSKSKLEAEPDSSKKQTEVVIFSTMEAVVEVTGKNTKAAAEFYKKAFGAKEIKRVECQKRKNDQEHPLLVSAELKIGSDHFMVMDSEIEFVNGSGILLYMETENLNEAISKAMEFGANQDRETNKEEDGCIFTELKDPFGTSRFIASFVAMDSFTPIESKLEPKAEPEASNEAASETEASVVA